MVFVFIETYGVTLSGYIPAELEIYKEWSRYGHVPIGNIPSDTWISITDVFFSRNLTDYKFVWWTSEGNRSDLGGLEEDDNLYENEHSNPIINAPGAYWSICVELHIGYLAINTIVQSEHIQSIELDAQQQDAPEFVPNIDSDDTVDNAAAEDLDEVCS
ncbi:hypothetical protein RFI_34448 [Reticulomyxa filosa]|uniref:DNA polymerase epsilon catalytic subunit n=1 Tax=Reticulomyxa filosa TaxID=46433 RepID=X6LM15_RETFI|nr:hypothetical protein RFI_34448 [Reticulomyxa filosa]|eukprot:ETO02963.1 hypothetical protein RFI_34448 [Reticulomyxa filosa]